MKRIKSSPNGMGQPDGTVQNSGGGRPNSAAPIKQGTTKRYGKSLKGKA